MCVVEAKYMLHGRRIYAYIAFISDYEKMGAKGGE